MEMACRLSATRCLNLQNRNVSSVVWVAQKHSSNFVGLTSCDRCQRVERNPRALPIARGGSCRSLHIPVKSSRSQNKTSRQSHKNKRRPSGRSSYRFVDRTRVKVAGGSGGKGSLSMNQLGRKHRRRPDGGHGGRGGDVIIVADPNEQTLRWTHPHVTAESGLHGSSQQKHGRNGQHRILRVPCGVVVRRVLDFDEVWDPVNHILVKVSDNHDPSNIDDSWSENEMNSQYLKDEDTETEQHTDYPLSFHDKEEEVEYGEDDGLPESEDIEATAGRQKIVLADLDTPGAHVLVARGGKGGRGNCIFASRSGPFPSAEELISRARPDEGEVSFLELELKLIADIGLVGFPNAGKSSLLAAMSRATPAIAPYPFTTLHPLIGCIEYRDGCRVFAADVPGLVGGASEGRGRGHDFLRHLERTKSFLYIVDAAGVDGRDPVEDLMTLVDEVAGYGDGDMLTKPAIVVANKLDLLDQTRGQSILQQMRSAAIETGIRFDGNVLGISAGVTGHGLGPLSVAIRNVVQQADTGQDDQHANHVMEATD